MIQRILVLGAGSAGLMAAVTLKRKLPQLEVTVVRSPEIGVIGVGEGSTAALDDAVRRADGIAEGGLFGFVVGLQLGGREHSIMDVDPTESAAQTEGCGGGDPVGIELAAQEDGGVWMCVDQPGGDEGRPEEVSMRSVALRLGGMSMELQDLALGCGRWM